MAQVIVNNITNCTFNERTKNVLKTLEELAHQYEEFEYNFGFDVKINANIIKSYYDDQYVDVIINARINPFTLLCINIIDDPRRAKSQLFCDKVICGCTDEIGFPSSMKLDEYYILGDMLKVFEKWKIPSGVDTKDFLNVLNKASKLNTTP